MIRQEIVLCEKCGSLKELTGECDCSYEEKEESPGAKDPDSG